MNFQTFLEVENKYTHMLLLPLLEIAGDVSS